MKRYELHTGDNREVLKTFADNSVDSIVCDPPYELKFMGAKWDSSGIAYNIDVWKECLRVLKPGGHLLAFGGSRTYHRLAVAIEDAGFEIRDCIMWIYGSGFPKSHDVSKALDKQAGAEREKRWKPITPHGMTGAMEHRPWIDRAQRDGGIYVDGETPATPLAQQWHGWGTALKPATENIIMAYKPHGTEHGIMIANLQKLEAQLWLMQYACSAEWSSTSSPSELGVVLSIAQWTVAELMSTRDDLLGQMDTLQLSEMANMCLSIVQSWKNAWEEASKLGNTFITETVLSPIIGWTTLKSSLSHLTLNSIIKALMQHGTMWQHALSAELPFVVASQKLKSTLELIAVERAISRTSNPASTDNRTTVEPIVVARKPLHGTVADNVQAWGVGALNIDGCRVGTEQTTTTIKDLSGAHGNQFGKAGVQYPKMGERLNPPGRWPANIIFDEEAAQMLDEQSGERHGGGQGRRVETKGMFGLGGDNKMNIWYPDSGGASRFFFNVKNEYTCPLCYNTYVKDMTTEELCESISVNSAENLGWTTLETTEFTAHVNALLSQNAQLVQNAKSAIPLCGLCAISIAVVLAETKTSGFSHQRCERILGYMPKYASSILIQSLASFVELWGNTDTIPTTQSLMMLYGYALHATENYIKQVKKERAADGNDLESGTSFRYIPKASKAEREAGLNAPNGQRANIHATVKPIALMRYLVRLVTPRGGVVLDPFMGSGTTGCAAMLEAMRFIGIELNQEYSDIAERRIRHWMAQNMMGI